MSLNTELILNLLEEDISSQRHDQVSIRACQALLDSILKKFVPKASRNSLRDAALNDFVEFNTSLSKDFVVPLAYAGIFSTWRDIVHSQFNSGEFSTNVLTLDSCLSKAYAGPGASIGTKHTDFVNKMFNSKLTYTKEGLYQHYSSALSPRWKSAELVRDQLHSREIVVGSRLSTVPKDATKDRTICVEPSLNMFYQLGAKFVIEDLLVKFYNIDVSQQPEINKNMARTGSIHDTYSTIDLKNASDSIHLGLIRYLLPKETFSVISLLRSPSTVVNGKAIELNMVSTMGNGFTFPLMTFLFASLIRAISIHKSMTFVNGVNFAVFGDDIIIARPAASLLIDILESAGFTVNIEKSFISGFFKESCGGDYFNGYDIRGVYIKEFHGDNTVYSIFNRLMRWSLRHDVSLHRTLSYVFELAQRKLYVPYDEGDDAGFKIPRSLLSRHDDRTGCTKYTCMRPQAYRRRVSDLYANPWGAFIGALGGYVRANTITIRPKVVRYRVERHKTPNWDFMPNPESFTIRDAVRSWIPILIGPGTAVSGISL
ncbi:MAG: RNA replicase beta chain [Sanya atkins-like virus 1]|nr:MAG: RNA replicase beta chain [Sanya atkins-like virus 1]